MGRVRERSVRPAPVQLELFPLLTASVPKKSRSPSPGLRGGAGSLERETVQDLDAGRQRLFLRLNRIMGQRLRSLTLTNNRSTILSAKPSSADEADGVDLRLHWSFVSAGEPTVRAVAAYTLGTARGKSRRRALSAIRDHFDRYWSEAGGRGHDRPAAHARSTKAPSQPLQPLGQWFDLGQICRELNLRFFEGRLSVNITWGQSSAGVARRRRRRRRTTSIELGSYTFEDSVVRVHRVLDQPHVPRYVVEAVVYHELLHAALPPVERHGRRWFHTPEFRELEKRYPLLEAAERWIDEHLTELQRRR